MVIKNAIRRSLDQEIMYGRRYSESQFHGESFHGQRRKGRIHAHLTTNFAG